MSTLRPLGDRILLLRAAAKEKTDSGIYIPEQAQETPQEATVVAVGAGGRDERGEIRPVELQAGETVLIGRYAGAEVEVLGETLVLVREADVIAVVG